MKLNPDTLTRLRVAGFIIVMLIAFAIPLSTVCQYEWPSVPPRSYLVPVTGYDPNDFSEATTCD